MNGRRLLTRRKTRGREQRRIYDKKIEGRDESGGGF